MTLAERYRCAKLAVEAAGYAEEIAWQANVRPEAMTERGLLCETAHVVLCSGFRASVVRAKWPALTVAFRGWVPARVLNLQADCLRKAEAVFGNRAKLRAILQAARDIRRVGFDELKRRILADPLKELRKFPFIGPVTVYHLAKSLGFQVAKPDRHLVRMAKAAGFDDVQAFCGQISRATGDPVPVVDIVLWRYATFNPDYRGLFAAEEVPT